MTRQEALARLIELQRSDDPEAAHAEADKIMLTLLREAGYARHCEEWHKIQPKWYA